jgi:hypothetical protein
MHLTKAAPLGVAGADRLRILIGPSEVAVSSDDDEREPGPQWLRDFASGLGVETTAYHGRKALYEASATG